MSLESNKATALKFLELLGQGRADEAPLSDKLTGWTILSGDIDGSEYLRRTKIFPSIFAKQLTFTIDAATAEDNRVLVQCRSKGTLVNDAVYENTYVFAFLFDEDRISKVSEYFNVKSAMDVLIPVLRSKM